MKIKNKELLTILKEKDALIKAMRKEQAQIEELQKSQYEKGIKVNGIKSRVGEIMEEVIPEDENTIIESVEVVKGEVIAKVLTLDEYIEKSKEIAINSWNTIKERAKPKE